MQTRSSTHNLRPAPAITKRYTPAAPAPARDAQPGARIIATAGDDDTIRIWDAGTGACQHVLRDHRRHVWALAFSKSGKRLYSGDAGGTIIVWDTEHWKPASILNATTGGVYCMAMAPDGEFMAYGGDSGDVHIIDLKREQHLRTLELNFAHNPVITLTYAPDGRTLVATADQRVFMIDTTTGEVQRELKGHTDVVMGVAYAPGGKFFVTASRDGTVRLWSGVVGKFMRALETRPSTELTAVAVQSNGTIYAGADDGSVWFSHAGSPCIYQLYKKHFKRISAIARMSERHTVTASFDSTVLIRDSWDYGNNIYLRGHTDYIQAVAILNK